MTRHSWHGPGRRFRVAWAADPTPEELAVFDELAAWIEAHPEALKR